MDAMVTARVPAEIKERGSAVLKSLDATPTDLVNAAYDYLLANGRLPEASPSIDSLRSKTRKLTKDQLSLLKQRFEKTTFNIPASYWTEKTDEERIADALRKKYASAH